MRLASFFSVTLLAPALAFSADLPEIKATHPMRGEITRFVTLPGTIRANQQATLYAKVPGYLKSLAVDMASTSRSSR